MFHFLRPRSASGAYSSQDSGIDDLQLATAGNTAGGITLDIDKDSVGGPLAR